jgi:decaprenylphospho-beta-D-ribofuranose 2-oxidase
MSAERILTGWGRATRSRSVVDDARSIGDVARALAAAGPRGVLPRGLGRSYGDQAQNAGGRVIDMTGLSGIVELDRARGAVTTLAGTSFDELLRELVPRGWFPPVVPGTRWVTIGGAIANDVHGKNHHRDGSIARHVERLTLSTPDGRRRTIGPADDPEAFAATAGGLGLTGVIVDATVRLLPIGSAWVRVDTERARDLDDLLARMDASDDAYRYSVAWVDCLSGGAALGRGILTRGDHASADELSRAGCDRPLAYRARTVGSVPAWSPPVLGPATTRAFNEAWFRRAPRRERGRLVPLTSFFHPLDSVGSWNRLYGRRGFVQHQFAVPLGQEDVIRSALERLSASGCASFLGVLKRFGPGRGMLSFPIEGWTLALDLPAAQRGIATLLDGLDRLVAEAGGRVYLAKDARLDPGLVPSMYPELDRWRGVRDRLDPRGLLRSDLERRLRIRGRPGKGVAA